MENKSIYASFINSKTNVLIPVLKNGKTLESRYNPESEAIKKLSLVDIKQNFYVVLGISSGTLLNELVKQNENAKIIALETCEDDFIFLENSPLFSKLKQNKNIIFTTPNALVQTLITHYIPSFYGKLEIIEQQAWCLENTQVYKTIKTLLNKSLEYISKDFSVQSHFGSLWQKNIINNLRLLQNYDLKYERKIDTKKTAVVVAAGPTLDKTINTLKEQDNLFIIATDTAYSTLLKNNIFCDVVVNIDAQTISTNHFIHQNNDKNTLFVFDLSSNNSICTYLENQGYNVFFTINNHPLSTYINTLSTNTFHPLFSGSGTVTIAALDLAFLFGFENIKVLGADFSYNNNKPYSKGTYLDTIYNINQNKINTLEKNYTNLMYRTPVSIKQNIITTSVLESYETSFIEYLKEKKAEFYKKDDIYFIQNAAPKNKIIIKSQKNNIIKTLFDDFKKASHNFFEKKSINELKNTDICLLPLISSLRNNENIKEDNFWHLLEIAYNTFLRLE